MKTASLHSLIWAFITALLAIKITEEIEVITGPVFIKSPNGKVEFLNTKGAILDCSAHGEPDPEIKWYKQDGRQQKPEIVASIPPLLRLMSNGSVLFNQFSSEEFRQDVHATVYKCAASNSHGTIVSQDVTVRATTEEQQQQLQAQVYDQYVIPGNIAVLRCHIPTFFKENLEVVAWIREDNVVVKRNQPGHGMKVSTDGHLYVDNVSSKKLKMGYWCQVRNRITKKVFLSQTSGRIMLTGPKASVPPTISDVSEDVTVEIGQAIGLNCAAQGFPAPIYTWSSSPDNKVVAQSSDLILKNIKEPGTYFYSCIARNKFGSDRKRAKIIVRAPLSASITPNIKVIKSEDEVKFKCDVGGHPVGSITWAYNGKRLQEQAEEVLRIPSANRQHEGMYQCFVSNKWETTHSTAQLVLGEVSPKFLKTFKAKKMQPGPSVSLKCIATGRPTPNMFWTANGRTIQISNKYIIREEKIPNGTIMSNLIIKNMRTSDGGVYHCNATNKIGYNVFSNTIDVYGLPIVQPMTNVTAAAGGTVKVNCYASGYPLRSIKWERGGLFSNLPKNVVTFANGTMVMRKIKKRNGGEYVCIASNGRGQTDSKSVFVNILAKPVIGGSEHDLLDLDEGNPFSVFCSVIKGDEPMKIQWMKDEAPVSMGQGTDIATTKMYSVLQIRGVRGKHAGNYTCVAINKAGQDTKTVQLRVSVSPKWKRKPEHAVSRVGGSVAIDCVAVGYPKPDIKWVKVVGREVKESFTAGTKHVIHSNGSLILTAVQSSDAGTYSCIASNGIGDDLIEGVTLSIKDTPVITTIQGPKTVPEGANVTLECKASNSMSLHWMKNKIKLETNSTKSKMLRNSVNETKTLLISLNNVTKEESGEYICVAQNENGQTQKTTNIFVKERRKYLKPTTVEPKITTYERARITSKHTGRKMNNGHPNSISSSTTASIISSKDKYGTYAPKLGDQLNNIEEQDYELMEPSSIFNKSFKFKTMMFIVPAVAVVVLLIAVIVTLVVYLITRSSSTTNHPATIRKCSDQSSSLGTLSRKRSSPSSTMDRRYGRLERPQPVPGDHRKSNISNGYEIPDYYAGMKPYSTLQLSSRFPPGMNTYNESQASV